MRGFEASSTVGDALVMVHSQGAAGNIAGRIISQDARVTNARVSGLDCSGYVVQGPREFQILQLAIVLRHTGWRGARVVCVVCEP